MKKIIDTNCKLNAIRFLRVTLITIGTLLTILALASCIQIDHVSQPQQVRVGDTVDITMVASTTSDDSGSYTPYAGIHLPSGWSVVGPVNYIGDHSGSLIYDDFLSSAIENEYPGDGYRWWVGHGSPHGPISASLTSTGTWHIQTGTQPGFYALDYVVGYGQYEPSDTRMTMPITVTTNYGGIWNPVKAPVAYVLAGQTTSLDIPLNLVNMGDLGTDSFHLSVGPPSGWSAQFLINGNPVIESGPLSLFQTQSITLRLSVPANVSPNQLTFPVVATSAANPGAQAVGRITVRIFGPEGFDPPIASGIRLRGRLGGLSDDMFVEGNYAYVEEGHGLTIWDVSNPGNSLKLGQSVQFPDLIEDIYVDGQYAYLVFEDEGLRIIDVSDPYHPVEASLYYFPDEAEHVVVADGYAYVALDGRPDHFQVMNVSDPHVPYPIDPILELPSSITDLAVNGNYLFVTTTGEGLIVFDRSVPDKPIQIGEYDANNVNVVAGSGTYAYLGTESGMEVVDVTDLTIPAGTYGSQNVEDISLVGNYAYLAMGYNGFRILNIGTPETPQEVGAYVPDGIVTKVAIVGNHAYLSLDGNGIDIIDISIPSQPVVVGHIHSGSSVKAVRVQNDRAYLGAYNGLQIVDVSSPDTPAITGVLWPGDSPDALTVVSNTAYVDAGISKLTVVDATDPTSPTILTNFEDFDQRSMIKNTEFQNNLVYVGIGYYGFRIIDVNTPSNPVKVGSYQSPSPEYVVENLVINDDYAYLAEALHGMEIVDISESDSPVRVGVYDWYTGSDTSRPGLTVANNLAYLTAPGRGFRVLDVSQPSQPQQIGINNNIWGYDVVVQDNYAYLVNGQGVKVIDISNLATPTPIAFYDTPGVAYRLDVISDTIYVADSDGGLLIFQLAPGFISGMTQTYFPLIMKNN